MKLSARNQLKGKVVDIKEGAVNGIVSLETKGGEIITSTISMGSTQVSVTPVPVIRTDAGKKTSAC